MAKKQRSDFITWLDHPDNGVFISLIIALAGGAMIAGLVAACIFLGVL